MTLTQKQNNRDPDDLRDHPFYALVSLCGTSYNIV